MTRLSTEEHNICRTYYKQAEPSEIQRFKAWHYSRFANTTVQGIYATVSRNSSTEILCCTWHLHGLVDNFRQDHLNEFQLSFLPDRRVWDCEKMLSTARSFNSHRRWRSLLQCCLGGTTAQHRRSFDHRFYCAYNGRNDSHVGEKFSSKIKLKKRTPSSIWDDADITRFYYVSTECGRTLRQRAHLIPFQLLTNDTDLGASHDVLEESRSQDVIVINTKSRNTFYNEYYHIKFTPNLRKVTGSVL